MLAATATRKKTERQSERASERESQGDSKWGFRIFGLERWRSYTDRSLVQGDQEKWQKYTKHTFRNTHRPSAELTGMVIEIENDILQFVCVV